MLFQFEDLIHFGLEFEFEVVVNLICFGQGLVSELNQLGVKFGYFLTRDVESAFPSPEELFSGDSVFFDEVAEETFILNVSFHGPYEVC